MNQLNEKLGIAGIFDGYPLIAVPHMADTVQTRKHKKKRINKKWLKRYGTKQVPWKKMLFFDGKIYGHPTMVNLIIERLQKGEQNVSITD